MGRANEFFGMDFNDPRPEPPEETYKDPIGRAEAFFGKVFSRPPGQPRQEPVKPAVASVDGNRLPQPNALEKDMAKSVMFSPEEKKVADAYESSPSTIASDVKELEREISRAKDPKIKSILQQELAKRETYYAQKR